MSAIEEELLKLESLTGSDFELNYRGRETNSQDEQYEETGASLLLTLPSNAVITSKGRKIVGRDPNISSPTLKSLIISDSKYISESLRERLATSSAEKIAEEEFMAHNEIGATHLAQCIKANLTQTMADLIADYSDDRRLPFVVGALYINAFMQGHKLFYYSFYPHDGYVMTEWEPKKIYIQPKATLPPKKHDFKKYYRVSKPVPGEIMPCPLCGSPAKLYRAGFRGKDSHVCCTNSDGDCRLFINMDIYESENDAIIAWNTLTRNQP